MAFIMTRLQVGDYDAFKPLFDQDSPGTRATATGYRLFRSVEDPNEVFIQVEFESAEDANAGRDKLLSAGVLERWSDRTGPTVVEVAETIVY
jgi:heme-degrading monooxygenase HmoA